LQENLDLALSLNLSKAFLALMDLWLVAYWSQPPSAASVSTRKEKLKVLPFYAVPLPFRSLFYDTTKPKDGPSFSLKLFRVFSTVNVPSARSYQSEAISLCRSRRATYKRPQSWHFVIAELDERIGASTGPCAWSTQKGESEARGVTVRGIHWRNAY